MQKLLEDLSSPQQRSLVIAALCPGAVTLASDPNGHLVILYCLKNFSFEYNKVMDDSSLHQMLLNFMKHMLLYIAFVYGHMLGDKSFDRDLHVPVELGLMCSYDRHL